VAGCHLAAPYLVGRDLRRLHRVEPADEVGRGSSRLTSSSKCCHEAGGDDGHEPRALRSPDVTTGGDWPTDPTPRDRLLHGIGRVCEVHVQLDLRLGMLLAGLAILAIPPDPEQAFKASLATDARLRRCRKLLVESALPEDLRLAGISALEDAREANKLRNRVVHDWWLERMEGSEASPFTRMQIAKGTPGLIAEPSDLAFVDNVEHRVHRAYVRVNSLVLAVGHAAVGAGVPLPEGFGYAEMLPEIRGEFDLNPDGTWNLRGTPDDG
jgi:hypothetical protein